MLDRHELAAVELGLRFVRGHAAGALGPAASTAQAKIRSIVPPAAAAAAGAMPVFIPPARARDSRPLRSLLDAVERRAKVLMSYRDEQGADTERTVWPLAMLFVGRHWIAAGWCELRDGFRSFRLDRVASLEVLATTYPDQPGRRLGGLLSGDGRAARRAGDGLRPRPLAGERSLVSPGT
jgi:predicted DNA-binding transcriptional regulator YafY